MNAKPEDIKNPVGVSNTFHNDEIKEAVTDAIKRVAGSIGTYKSIPISSLVPAPKEWNNFSDISDSDKLNMVESIARNGLLQPIVVRSLAADDSKYQILAGHTRVECYKMLYSASHDEKYKNIDSMVFESNELSDIQAREIITDTNFYQRGKLSPHDRSFCIVTKLKSLKERKVPGDLLSHVAKQFGMKRASISIWKRMINLIPEFEDMYVRGEIKLLTASKIACFPLETQREILQRKEFIDDKIISKLPAKTLPSMVIKTLEKILEDKERPVIPKARIVETHTDDNKYTISVDKKPGRLERPVLLYLPENKFEKFLERYKRYIVEDQTPSGTKM